MSRVTAIGLMSGTSYDGVDVALIETDGEEIGSLGPTGYRPYSDQERDLLRRAIAVATNLGDRTERPKILAQVEELVTDMHAEAVEAFLAANGMATSAVGVVGFHGQTVLLRPARAERPQLVGRRAASVPPVPRAARRHRLDLRQPQRQRQGRGVGMDVVQAHGRRRASRPRGRPEVADFAAVRGRVARGAERLELRRVHDLVRADAQHVVERGTGRRHGLRLARLRLDLHRARDADAAEQPG